MNYNYCNFIEQCINSVINQNEKDYELIIIDGGSNDLSLSILNKYKIHFTYFISEKDNGQSHALNKGLKMASGDYIFWLNSDDFLIKNSLGLIKKFIQTNTSFQWFTANTIFVNESNKIIKFYNSISYNKILNKNTFINVGGPSSIVKKSIYEKVGYFNESLNFTMDSDMWIRINNLNYKYRNIQIYLWGFRLHINSKTTSSHYNKFNIKHLDEIALLKSKYNIKSSFLISCLEKYFKLMSIKYLMAFYRSFIYKNETILNFENNKH